jgi:hypothetical protein
MSTSPPMNAASTPLALSDAGAPARSSWLTTVEHRLAAIVDGANPILVKETRQALKSRQFIVTFFIVLAACWIASFGGVAVIGPQIYYGASGSTMLVWYYAILAFPLAVIVPYSAFRSLAVEQEENTFDLLSITTLSSRQIVSGKLWSAIVQMLVYLSAVSPCIAFTFLLRGVDAMTTAMLLAIAVLGSLALSMIALFVGAAARAKHMQIITSVALVLALFGAFLGAVLISIGLVQSSIPADPELWAVLGVFAAIYVTTFGLLHTAAAAQISFASENRSTPIRRWMMAQQACFIGGVAGITFAFGRTWEVVAFTSVFSMLVAAFYWQVMGALLTGEWPHLSRRVQRSLPQSALGRAFLSFFNPGPAAGYMFAVANITMVAVVALFALFWSQIYGSRSTDEQVYAVILAWSYVVGYLGIGRLVIGAMRRFSYVSLTAGFLIQLLLVLAGVGVPLTIQVTSRMLRNSGYTLLQMPNPFWTLAELLDHGSRAVQAPILILVLPAIAIAVLMLNMPAVATELGRHRVAAPERVIEEEAELHPAPTPGPSSPWDVVEETT